MTAWYWRLAYPTKRCAKKGGILNLLSILKPNMFYSDNEQIIPIARKILSQKDATKASALDGIPAIVPALVPVLPALFQISYNSGIFPRSWKIAHIQPNPKKGFKTLLNNYRPRSLLSVVSKAIEKYLNIVILKYFEHNKLIHDRQYGFRNRSWSSRHHCRPPFLLTHSWRKSWQWTSQKLLTKFGSRYFWTNN